MSAKYYVENYEISTGGIRLNIEPMMGEFPGVADKAKLALAIDRFVSEYKGD